MKTSPLPPPKSRGRDAMEWLEHHGVTPRKSIPIRSSDYNILLECPFNYYLTRHLGLSSGVHYSKALSRGSWFHKRLEYFWRPNEVAESRMQLHLKERLQEIQTACDAYGFDQDHFLNLKEREERDFQTVMGWYEASLKVTIPASAATGRPTTWGDYLMNPNYIVLGQELLAVIQSELTPGCPLVAQFDILIFDKRTNQLWIVDAKTCSESPTLRLAICPIEFQTQHYLYILTQLLTSGLLHKKFPQLPEKVTVGGMAHIGVQKPSIDFCQSDRPFKWVEHTLKSGKRKGQIELRKEYLSDEPSFQCYLDRVKRWYEGTGEYVTEASDRVLDPPVNLSWSGKNVVLDEDGFNQYKKRLAFIYAHASSEPYPENFLSNPRSCRKKDGNLTDLAPFYLLPPTDWPTVIASNRLIQLHRDDLISNNTPTGVYLAEAIERPEET